MGMWKKPITPDIMSYRTEVSGRPPTEGFIATVTLPPCGRSFTGEQAWTKQDAEQSAAALALTYIEQADAPQANLLSPPQQLPTSQPLLQLSPPLPAPPLPPQPPSHWLQLAPLPPRSLQQQNPPQVHDAGFDQLNVASCPSQPPAPPLYWLQQLQTSASLEPRQEVLSQKPQPSLQMNSEPVLFQATQSHENAKSRLSALVESRWKAKANELVSYDTQRDGRPPSETFMSTVTLVRCQQIFTGEKVRSKKGAEQAAAALAEAYLLAVE